MRDATVSLALAVICVQEDGQGILAIRLGEHIRRCRQQQQCSVRPQRQANYHSISRKRHCLECQAGHLGVYAVNYQQLSMHCCARCLMERQAPFEQLLLLPQVKTLITPASSGRAPAEVTQIAVGRSDSHQIAVGHADGTVCLRLLTKVTKPEMFHPASTDFSAVTQAKHDCMYSRSPSHIQKCCPMYFHKQKQLCLFEGSSVEPTVRHL